MQRAVNTTLSKKYLLNRPNDICLWNSTARHSYALAIVKLVMELTKIIN